MKQQRQTRKKSLARFRHSRERGNPGKSILPLPDWTPAFAGVTALETSFETINK